MKLRTAPAAGLSLLLSTAPSFADDGVPIQLRWQAPPSCPQAAQVRQKLRDLLGRNGADAPSRLRAEGRIEPVGGKFRLTLEIHYELVEGTRTVQASACQDLGGAAALTLALLFRAEHGSTALTARELGGPSLRPAGDGDFADLEKQEPPDAARAPKDESTAPDVPKRGAARASDVSQEFALDESRRDAGSPPSKQSRWRFALRVPELRTDIGVMPKASYGLGIGAGARHDAWRISIAGTLWFAQTYEPGPFVGYGAVFLRVSGELSACHGFRVAGFELAPCLLVTVDDVSARGTGIGISSSSPHATWVSVGGGVYGIWSLGRWAALVAGVNFRIATSRPRFVSDPIGEISQVGPAALGAVVGCDWQF